MRKLILLLFLLPTIALGQTLDLPGRSQNRNTQSNEAYSAHVCNDYCTMVACYFYHGEKGHSCTSRCSEKVVEEEIEVELKVEDMEGDEGIEIIEEEGDIDADVVFTIVEKMPQFGSGEADLLNYLAWNIKYPQMAKNSGISGIVYVTFIVGKKGKVRDVRILRGIGGGCDEEAVRVVKSMPNWRPGKQRGKAVSVYYNLPVRFVLR